MKKRHLSDKALIGGMIKTQILLRKIKEMTNKPIKYLLHDMAEREYKKIMKKKGKQ